MENVIKVKKAKYRSTKTLVRNLIIVILMGMASGFLLGMWMVSNKVDPNLYNIDISKLYDNVEVIRSEAQGKTPAQLGATKSCVLAFDNTFNSENVSIIGSGSVVAMGFTQTIYSRAMKVGSRVFSESISTGSVVTAADRFYQDGKKITHLKGSLSGNTANWNAGQNEMTADEYFQSMGGNLNEFMLYIVSSKTVNNASEVETLENGNYKFVLNLDRVKSVAKYVKSMKTTGGLASFPEFRNDIKLTVTVDSSFRLVEVTSDETYGAKKAGIPITAESVGTLTNKFSYDGEFIIPESNEKTVF